MCTLSRHDAGTETQREEDRDLGRDRDSRKKEIETREEGARLSGVVERRERNSERNGESGRKRQRPRGSGTEIQRERGTETQSVGQRPREGCQAPRERGTDTQDWRQTRVPQKKREKDRKRQHL